MPSTVEIAVSMIGRKRAELASTAASHTSLPAARSASIWPSRITAFLVIMPSSARMPRMATKPSGLPDSSSAPTTPISPSGPTLSTMNSRWKLCSWNISTVSMMKQHHRHDGEDRGLRLGTLLHRAADRDGIARRQRLAASSRDGLVERAHHLLRQHARADVGLHGQVRHAVAPPDQRIFLLVVEAGELASGTVRPLGSGTCRVRRPSSDTRCSSVARATTSTR